MMTSTVPFALVVDDDVYTRIDACDILKDAGFRCSDAETGEAARAYLEDEAEGVTLLFTDAEMPGELDGFGLARHVHQHWPWIEIVVASGHISPNEDDLPPKATFINKPFSARIVHEHLRDKLPDGKKPEPLKHAR